MLGGVARTATYFPSQFQGCNIPQLFHLLVGVDQRGKKGLCLHAGLTLMLLGSLSDALTTPAGTRGSHGTQSQREVGAAGFLSHTLQIGFSGFDGYNTVRLILAGQRSDQ